MRQPFSLSRPSLVAATLLAALAAGPDASATDPEAICEPPDVLVSMLTGKPHFERRALVLQDEMPGQGHRLELFMNSGEGGRHSYTLLRLRRGEKEACILTAGTVAGRKTDAAGRTHVTLDDENDADTFDLVVCPSHYVITRTVSEENVCEDTKSRAASGRLIASFGKIIEDNRAAIPWPAK